MFHEGCRRVFYGLNGRPYPGEWADCAAFAGCDQAKYVSNADLIQLRKNRSLTRRGG